MTRKQLFWFDYLGQVLEQRRQELKTILGPCHPPLSHWDESIYNAYEQLRKAR